MDLELKGKVAIVGGGSKGLGRACAEVLAAEGAKVTICSRNKERLGEGGCRNSYCNRIGCSGFSGRFGQERHD